MTAIVAPIGTDREAAEPVGSLANCSEREPHACSRLRLSLVMMNGGPSVDAAQVPARLGL